MSKLTMRDTSHVAEDSPEDVTVAAEESSDSDTDTHAADDRTATSNGAEGVAAEAPTDDDAPEIAADGDGDDGGGGDGSGDSNTTQATGGGGVNWTRVLAYGVLPTLAFIMAMLAGYLKWVDSSARSAEAAGIESVQVARDATVALLSYKPDTVEQDLTAARDRLTGVFRDSYTQLTNDVVIPGSKQQQITAVATVPAAASVSADRNRAVVLVFVNQTTTIGTDRPTDTASSVRVTLDKVGDRWLVSGFDPV
jgi:Mce-associated membrane protein